MRTRAALSLALAVLAFVPAQSALAQTEEQRLRQELEAQRAINEQLRKRIDELERQISGERAPALQPLERRETRLEAETPEATTAIREALVQKGLVLLPSGSYRLTPGFDWVHTGADAARSRSDLYSLSLGLGAGLPQGFMFSANLPYVHRNTSIGSNSGVGDLSIGLSKALADESEGLPAFVGSVTYRADNGKDPFARVPIGFGFPVIGASLSALKTVAPVVMYGGLFYSHPMEKNVTAEGFSGRITPGDAWGYRLGASLAATPDITLDASLSNSFIRGTRVRPDAAAEFTLPRATTAFLNLGAGLLLTRNLSLLINASAGATKDSADYIFSLALPYRF